MGMCHSPFALLFFYRKVGDNLVDSNKSLTFAHAKTMVP